MSKVKGRPLAASDRARLERYVQTHGEVAARGATGMSGGTLARALAGLTVYEGTHALCARLPADSDPPAPLRQAV
jgi:hypothetical protein